MIFTLARPLYITKISMQFSNSVGSGRVPLSQEILLYRLTAIFFDYLRMRYVFTVNIPNYPGKL
jgi:hypothetical protein